MFGARKVCSMSVEIFARKKCSRYFVCYQSFQPLGKWVSRVDLDLSGVAWDWHSSKGGWKTSKRYFQYAFSWIYYRTHAMILFFRRSMLTHGDAWMNLRLNKWACAVHQRSVKFRDSNDTSFNFAYREPNEPSEFYGRLHVPFWA